MSNGVKQSKIRIFYMPTWYVDQDGVMYNYQQIKCYEYKKKETIKQWEQLDDQKRLHTVVRVQIFGRAAKQLELF